MSKGVDELTCLTRSDVGGHSGKRRPDTGRCVQWTSGRRRLPGGVIARSTRRSSSLHVSASSAPESGPQEWM